MKAGKVQTTGLLWVLMLKGPSRDDDPAHGLHTAINKHGVCEKL